MFRVGEPYAAEAQIRDNDTEPPPYIYVQPVGQAVVVGGTARFHVGVEGWPPITYGWRRNGVSLAGATNSMLVLTNVQLSDAGQYSVLATNAGGALLSSNVTLTVVPPGGPGSLDLTFDPSAGGQFVGLAQEAVELSALAVQADGCILIGGRFVGVDGVPRRAVARLNADGSLDRNFNAPPIVGSEEWSSSATDLAVQADGKVLVADSTQLVRLNTDGSLDEAFHPESASHCYHVVLQPNGRLIISGMDLGHAYVDRLQADGRRDPSFQRREFNGYAPVLALQPDGKILTGGERGGGAFVERLNADGTVDTIFSATISGGGFPTVSAVASATEGKVIIGGGFERVNDQERCGVARLNADGTLDTSFEPRLPSAPFHPIIYAVAAWPDGSVIIAGTRPLVLGSGWSYPAFPLLLKLAPDGQEDLAFTTELGGFLRGQNNYVSELAVQADGRILGAGRLVDYALVRLASSGTPDTSFDPNVQSAPGIVEALSLQPDGDVLVLGQFASVAGQACPHLARLSFDGTLNPSFVLALPAGYRVGSHAVQADGKVVISAGAAQPLLSELLRCNADGSLDSSFAPTVRRGEDDELAQIGRLLIQPDGRILIAGDFTFVNGVARRDLARLFPDGTLDESFGVGTGLGTQYDYARINALALQPDGRMLVGGAFNSIDGMPRHLLARLNSDGSVDASFHASYLDQFTNGPVRAVASLALQPDGRVLVGLDRLTFPDAGPALVRLNHDGSLDASFHLGVGISAATDVGNVSALALQADGKILVAGAFDTYDGEERPNLVRLNADGTLASNFVVPWGYAERGQDPWEVGEVRALALQPDGRILIGGWFKSIAGLPRWGVARLLGDTGTNAPCSAAPPGLVAWWRAEGNAIEASSDLLTWTDLVALTNLSGRVSFQDPTAASLSQRFYRARLEPSSPAITR